MSFKSFEKRSSVQYGGGWWRGAAGNHRSATNSRLRWMLMFYQTVAPTVCRCEVHEQEA